MLAGERRWGAAEEAFRRALELNQGYLTAHHWYGWLLTHLARHDEAIEYLRGAKALDPLSAIVREDLAAAYFHARRFHEALDEQEACLEARICPPSWGRVRSRTLLAVGRPETALAAARNAPEEVMALAALDREEEARRILRSYLEQPRSVGDAMEPSAGALERPITHLYLAEMYVALGDFDRALDAVERAEELGLATGPVLIREWPTFDPIRDHRRFRAVLERLDQPAE